MLRERQYVMRRAALAVDIALGVVAFFLAHWIRQAILSPLLAPRWIVAVPDWKGYAWLLGAVPPLAALTMHLHRCYDDLQPRRRRWGSAALAAAVAEAAALAFLAAALFDPEGRISRTQTALLALTYYPLLEARQAAFLWLERRRQAEPGGRGIVVIAGGGAPLRSMLECMRQSECWGFELAGVLLESDDDAQWLNSGDPILGSMADALGVLRSRPVDAFLLAPSQTALPELASLMRGCEEIGAPTYFSLETFGHEIARPSLEWFDTIPLAAYSPVREFGPALLLKLLVDRLASAALLVALSPVLAASALAIRFNSRRGEPILFSQIRLGRNGKPFRMWKFRTMRVGAEMQLSELLERNEADGPVFKMRDDPRVTAVGRVLRRWSLDELPQLWNTLKGEMSLVGPRPPLPAEAARYEPWQRRRLSMRPGITGLAQVSGRSDLSFEEWMKLDLRYIDNWSLWLDARILCRTIWAILSGRGAR
ncbi:MAG: putative sugar transferase EpsL [candidate division BRC1 bacterium ADurb.BinA364]|nr:MAG: putative sugar transferase EpsL [candidate division BRC1 bacterium ADurb.BinA364]